MGLISKGPLRLVSKISDKVRPILKKVWLPLFVFFLRYPLLSLLCVDKCISTILLTLSLSLSSMATTASSSLPRNYSFTTPRPPHSFIHGSPVAKTLPLYLRRDRRVALTYRLDKNSKQRSGGNVRCEATEVSSSSSVTSPGRNWVPVVPLSALPKGERRVIIQDDETILLLWYKNDVFAIENRSPAEGAYSEGLLNAKLTQVSTSFTYSYCFRHLSFLRRWNLYGCAISN